VFGEVTLAQVSNSANSRSVISLTAARDRSGLPVPSVNREPGGARNDRGGEAPRPGAWEDTITTEQKVIRAQVGLLELAKQLGNVSQGCKVVGYSRASFYRFKELYDKAANWRCKKSAARSRS
jgi:hypothetical protein